MTKLFNVYLDTTNLEALNKYRSSGFCTANWEPKERWELIAWNCCDFQAKEVAEQYPHATRVELDQKIRVYSNCGGRDYEGKDRVDIESQIQNAPTGEVESFEWQGGTLLVKRKGFFAEDFWVDENRGASNE